eukprot:9279-Heterococcus_DN1.PRE.3
MKRPFISSELETPKCNGIFLNCVLTPQGITAPLKQLQLSSASSRTQPIHEHTHATRAAATVHGLGCRSMDQDLLRDRVAILQDRVYYIALKATPSPAARKQHHFFSIDSELIYWNFFLDFGPLNLGQLYRFCQGLNAKLRDERLRDKIIYFYSSSHPHRKANASLLIAAWSLIYLHRTPDEAIRPFRHMIAALQPFHDASPCMFNIAAYEHYEQVSKVLQQTAPQLRLAKLAKHAVDKYFGIFLAFAGPHNKAELTTDGYRTLTPDDYIPYFQKHNVTLVIRLNKKYYDESKAGLGRTGTCIGCYLMKHYKVTAAEIIGWMRICRPGSVIGPQQHYMQDMEQLLWREGDLYRASLTADTASSSSAAAAAAATTQSAYTSSKFAGSAGSSSVRKPSLLTTPTAANHRSSTASSSHANSTTAAQRQRRGSHQSTLDSVTRGLRAVALEQQQQQYNKQQQSTVRRSRAIETRQQQASILLQQQLRTVSRNGTSSNSTAYSQQYRPSALSEQLAKASNVYGVSDVYSNPYNSNSTSSAAISQGDLLRSRRYAATGRYSSSSSSNNNSSGLQAALRGDNSRR